MKNQLLIALIGIGLIASPALADVELHSTKHNIRIIQGKPNSDGNETYIYQSWNKPKQIGEGAPDFEIKNGIFSNNYYAMMEGNSCSQNFYDFQKGDTDFFVEEGLAATNRDCFPKAPPKHAAGQLTVIIKGKEKAHYWLYEK